MTSFLSRSPDAAPLWMVAASAGIHAVCILAIVMLSGPMRAQQIRPRETITEVKLVKSVPVPPKIEKIEPSIPTEPAALPQEPTIQTAQPVEPAAKSRPLVTGQLAKATSDKIKVRGRKKPMRQVKAPKTAEKKPEEPAKKKDDPEKLLEESIAAIRKQVEAKRTGAVQSPPDRSSEQTPRQGVAGSPDGADTVDRDLLMWLAAVRSKINARWSVFSDNRQSERATVVGVQIENDGRLVEATIDESSGDEVLDRSAIRAVWQASPFPQVPAGAAEKIRSAGGLAFRFTVKGLQ